MAVYNKEVIIEKLLDQIGFDFSHRRVAAAASIEMAFDLTLDGRLSPKDNASGTARDYALRLKAGAGPAVPAGGGDGAMISGVSPVPVQTMDSIAALSPEEKIAYANEVAFRKWGWK